MPQETPLGSGETTFRAYVENCFPQSPTDLWKELPPDLQTRWKRVEQAVMAAYEGENTK